MIEDDDATGMWWPVGGPGEVQYRPTRIKNSRIVADYIQQHVHVRREVVQAGGHIGLWPKRLSLLFKTVYTFEPDADNFSSLCHNVLESNVFAFRAVLGERHGGVSITRTKMESGAHYVKPQSDGPVPCIKIDDLCLRHLDLVVLDVEGSEMPALRGAEQTIRWNWPRVILEVGSWNGQHGYGDAVQWLSSMGYKDEGVVLGHDRMFVKESR